MGVEEMERIRQAGVVLALATAWLVAPLGAAFAADEEIQVYMDEIRRLDARQLGCSHAISASRPARWRPSGWWKCFPVWDR